MICERPPYRIPTLPEFLRRVIEVLGDPQPSVEVERVRAGLLLAVLVLEVNSLALSPEERERHRREVERIIKGLVLVISGSIGQAELNNFPGGPQAQKSLPTLPPIEVWVLRVKSSLTRFVFWLVRLWRWQKRNRGTLPPSPG